VFSIEPWRPQSQHPCLHPHHKALRTQSQPHLQSPTNTHSLSFTQGFLLGQLSIALLIFFFIKFFIFGEPPSADDRSLHLNSLRRARTLAHQQSLKQLRTRSNSISLSLRHKDSRSIIRKGEETRGGPSIATILAKTYYNVKGHQPESLDWFNVLIAQTIAQLRADARQDDAILGSLTEVLNSGSKPDWIGEIKVNEIALGDEFPIFSNCRVMPAEDGFWYGPGTTGTEEGRLQARMDVDLSDVITIGIETTLNLNWPKPLSAVLPVALAVSIVRFSGTLALSFIPSSSPPSTSAPSPTTKDHHHNRSNSTTSSSTGPPPHRPTTLAFTFLDDYRLDLSVRSLVGSRSRLQDVPKIAQLIESRVHAWFDERAVEPRFQQIVLPSLWPRKHNTRGGATEDVDAEGVEMGDLEEDVIQEEEEEEYRLPVPPPPAVRHPAAPSNTLEAEGAKLREAEIRAGVRKQDRPGISRQTSSRDEGVRYRPKMTSRSATTEGWSGQKGMPGALAPGAFR
jgi:maintenance of morphology protein 1